MDKRWNGPRIADPRQRGALGRLVHYQLLAPQTGIAELLSTQLANGMHIAALVCDGIRVGTVKVLVSK